MAPWTGIEPVITAPETIALSTWLPGHKHLSIITHDYPISLA